MEILAAPENLVFQAQEVSLGLLESREQRESRDHWEHLERMVVQVLQVPSATEDPPEPWEFQAPRGSTETQARQVNKAQLECPVKGDHLAKTERLDLLDHLDHQVLQVTEVNKDPLV